MLVLSRRCHDLIRFPELGITIEILKVQGSSVRFGVDAPLEIKVIRGELESKQTNEITKRIVISEQSEHDVRNQLNNLSIATALVNKLLSNGKTNLAASVLNDALDRVNGQSICLPQDSVDEHSRAVALLVEDVANEREMLAGFLRLHGYEVETAKDGVEAIEFLDEHEKPDFILMDMNLPRMDGPSSIRKIRSNPAFDVVEIFAVSGQTPADIGIDVEASHISKWFRKPLEPSKLVQAINRHLSHSVTA